MAAAARSASRLARRLGARALRFAGWAPGQAAAKSRAAGDGSVHWPRLGAGQPGQSCRAGLAMEEEAGLGRMPFSPSLALGQAAAAPARGKMATRAHPHPFERGGVRMRRAPRGEELGACVRRSLLSPAPRPRVGLLHRSRS